MRHRIEAEFRLKIEDKDKEIRKLKEDIQTQQNKYVGELETYKIRAQYDLDMLHEKV